MSLLVQLKKIKTFVFDVDGVLTDGALLILDDGQMVRKMNIKDGYALQLALKQGYRVIIISGGRSESVRDRLNKLGIQDVFLKVEDKKQCLSDYVEKHGLLWSEVSFMGDDIPDYSVMKLVGLPCSPGDAVPEIKHISKYISAQKGGDGCARDIIEKVLKLNNHWPLDTSVSSK